MGNMSYCRFENTFNDLRDCYNNMEDDLSGSEKRCRQQLIDLCKRISDEFGDHEFEDEDEDEDMIE
jgi:hypothetical protein